MTSHRSRSPSLDEDSSAGAAAQAQSSVLHNSASGASPSRSKSSAPPDLTGRGGSLPQPASSPSLRRRGNLEPLSTWTSERPASMHAASASSHTLDDLASPTHRIQSRTSADSINHHGLKSCLKGTASPTQEAALTQASKIPDSPTASHSASSHGHGKSVQISPDLPRRRSHHSTISTADPTTPLRNRSCTIASSATLAAHRRLNRVAQGSRDADSAQSSEDQQLQRAQSLHSSPTLTTSTYESEEEGPPLMTPLDEHGHQDLDPDDKPKEDPLRSLASVHNVSQQREQASAAPHRVPDRARLDPKGPGSASGSDAGSTLNHSALTALGQARRATPPAGHGASSSARDSPYSWPVSSKSAVSIGLQWGLGVGIGTDASQVLSRYSSAPATMSARGMPRFQRPGAPDSLDLSGLKSALGIAEKSNVREGRPLSQSEKDDNELSREIVERDESELARRKTTGGLHRDGAGRSDGKRRPARIGTHDGQSERVVGRPRHSPQASRANVHSAATTKDQVIAPTSPVFDHINLHPASSPYHTPGLSHRGCHSSELSGAVPSSDASVEGEAQGDSLADVEGAVMGIGESGHFGPGVRAKVANVMDALVGTIPLAGTEGEALNIVEFGMTNSRSGLLLRPIISALARKAQQLHKYAKASQQEIDYFGDTSEHHKAGVASTAATFTIVHQDPRASDMRPMMKVLETHPKSYLDPHWQSNHKPRLTDAVFPSFVIRPFGSRIAPFRSMITGMSLMDLHWLQGRDESLQKSERASSEMISFLKTRAQEFKKDGLLFVAYVARGNDEGTNPSVSSSSVAPTRGSSGGANATTGMHSRSASLQGSRDLWTLLANLIAPCIQRLVSCGVINVDIARRMLDLPLYPRSAKETKAALHAVDQQWKLEYSCGLGQEGIVESTRGSDHELFNSPEPLTLTHRAWTTYKSGCLEDAPFTEHIVHLIRNVYEPHFRTVLRDRAKFSTGAVEFLHDTLWDILKNRVRDQGLKSISGLDAEFCIFALRRR